VETTNRDRRIFDSIVNPACRTVLTDSTWLRIGHPRRAPALSSPCTRRALQSRFHYSKPSPVGKDISRIDCVTPRAVGSKVFVAELGRSENLVRSRYHHIWREQLRPRAAAREKLPVCTRPSYGDVACALRRRAPSKTTASRFRKNRARDRCRRISNSLGPHRMFCCICGRTQSINYIASGLFRVGRYRPPPERAACGHRSR